MSSKLVQCQYVWIDGSLKNFRTKDKTWNKKPDQVKELPTMEFCGSATDFDVGNLADYYSKPACLFPDPFRLQSGVIVFCDTYSRDRLPTFANNRFRLLSVEKNDVPVIFWQTYSVLRTDGRPLSYGQNEETNSNFSYGKEISEAHYRACLYAGIAFQSIEVVAFKGQWRYTVGDLTGVALGDQVWMSRYLLQRIAEDFGVIVSFDASVLELKTTTLMSHQQHMISERLLTKFQLQDMKIVPVRENIQIQGLSGEVDPYAILIKVYEALDGNKGEENDVNSNSTKSGTLL